MPIIYIIEQKMKMDCRETAPLLLRTLILGNFQIGFFSGDNKGVNKVSKSFSGKLVLTRRISKGIELLRATQTWSLYALFFIK
jgi:hypothetical protein